MTSALFAIATGDTERARAIVTTTDEIDDDTRAILSDALAPGLTGSQLAESLGDALRSLGADRHLVNECYRVAFYSGDSWVAMSNNPLFSYFTANKTGMAADKWVHYFPIYERHLAAYRGRACRVLEIGVSRGGGLKLLSHFLGSEAYVVGMDIETGTQRAVGSAYTVEIGDQADPEFLRGVAERRGPFDVVIDDGGHTMKQQVTSVQTLFPLLAEGGTYIVEDCHTSYWPEYSDQTPGEPTFLDWLKARVDDLHAYHFSTSRDLLEPWQTDLAGLHVYDSIAVLDKKHRDAPFAEISGASEYINYDRLAVATEEELLASRDLAWARVAEVELRASEVEVEAVRQEAFRNELLDLRAKVVEQQEELGLTQSSLLGSWGIIREMRRSRSWRLTAPLRRVKSVFRRQ